MSDSYETSSAGRGSGHRLARLAAAAVLAAPLGACDFLDELVSVEAPSRIEADVLEQPQNAATLLAGVQGDFECALSMYVHFAGGFGDETEYAQGSASWIAIQARRTPRSGFDAAYANGTCSNPHQTTVPGVWKPLQTARYQGDHLIALLDEWGAQVTNPDPIRAKAAAYAGYAYVLLGESMCQAAFDLGPAVGTQAIFELALDRFDVTLGLSADPALVGLANVGSARALHRLGRLAEAAQHARLVPAGFVFNAGMAETPARRRNWVYYGNNEANHVTVEPSYRDSPDPRIAVVNTGRLASSGLPIYVQTRYASRAAPIPVATWEEAQLIIAEAELDAGDLTAAVAAINAVRTRPGVALAPFSSGDPAAIRAQILSERRAEFFLEGHRLGDIRFYDLPLSPPAGAIYPLGGSYEDARCLPIPLDEEINNPNL